MELNFLGIVIDYDKNKNDYTLRHPFFVSFRDDKEAKDCLLEDIFN